MAEQILEPAIALGRLTGADYTLLRVIKPATVGNYGNAIRPTDEFGQSICRQIQVLHGEVQAEAEDYLRRVAERLRCRSLAVRTRVVSSEQAAAAILEEARANPADLVALETHGWGGLARLFAGSVADKVLRGGATPLLVHRPPAPLPGAESGREVAGAGEVAGPPAACDGAPSRGERQARVHPGAGVGAR
jgi:nucleotide-binding universal stress UspA family protein